MTAPHLKTGAPRAAEVRYADWLLRVSIVLFALGLARGLFTRAGSHIGSVALVEWNIDHSHILLGEKLAASLILVCALSLLYRPTTLALLIIAGVVFAEACAGVRAAGFPFFELTPYTHALRYLTPLALIPLISSAGLLPSPVARCRISAWMLRIGLATVFVTHGYEAWMLHPQFIDFIIGGGRTLGGLDISEATASSLLKAIAVTDFIVAALLLVYASRILLGWLCFWGLVTALSRPISLGFASYPDVLLRAGHFLAPVAVWLLVRAIRPKKNVAEEPGNLS